MNTIDKYIVQIKKELQYLDGNLDLVPEHESLLRSEFEDFKENTNNLNTISELESIFVSQLESPTEIANSLFFHQYNFGKISRKDWKLFINALFILFTISYFSQAFVQVYLNSTIGKWYDTPNFNSAIAIIYWTVIVGLFTVIGRICYRDYISFRFVKPAKESFILVVKKTIRLSCIASIILLIHGVTSSLFDYCDGCGATHGIRVLFNISFQNGRPDAFIFWLLFIALIFIFKFIVTTLKNESNGIQYTNKEKETESS